MDRATRILHDANANMLVGADEGRVCGIEDIDVDDELFRIEYQSTPDGAHAIAFCRYCPFPNSYDYMTSHIRADDGLLCLGPDHTDIVASSTMDLATAIARARYWAAGFVVLQQTGNFPQP